MELPSLQASKQAEAEEKLQKARNSAAAGQERSREAARHAAESREKVHRLEGAQSSLLAEREQLLREVGTTVLGAASNHTLSSVKIQHSLQCPCKAYHNSGFNDVCRQEMQMQGILGE